MAFIPTSIDSLKSALNKYSFINKSDLFIYYLIYGCIEPNYGPGTAVRVG